MARRYQVAILGGGFPVPAGEAATFNRSELVSRDGQVLATYDKIHLFDVDLPDGNTYTESTTISAGTLPPVAELPGLCRVGLSICYDVRFPELYRHLAGAGAELLMVPAAFTAYTGKDHWQVLLQARAIENTSYVLAPAQTGLHYGRRQSHGHALVIDPWGTVRRCRRGPWCGHRPNRHRPPAAHSRSDAKPASPSTCPVLRPLMFKARCWASGLMAGVLASQLVSVLPARAFSRLAAWAITAKGELLLRTSPNLDLDAFFKDGDSRYGDRIWIDFPAVPSGPARSPAKGWFAKSVWECPSAV